MKYKKENLFWNDEHNINWFNNYPVSDYWVKFLKTINNKQEKKVLDLGCGAGRHTELLKSLDFNTYACDKYIGMVSKTQKRMLLCGWTNKKIKTRITKQSTNNLFYPSSFFDLIICHGVYHNAFNFRIFKKSILESSRILKKGGVLLFNIFTNEVISKSFKFLDKNNFLYLTKENLRMVLVSPDMFLKIAASKRLIPLKSKYFVRYLSNVSTGKRSVFRGILIKN